MFFSLDVYIYMYIDRSCSAYYRMDSLNNLFTQILLHLFLRICEKICVSSAEIRLMPVRRREERQGAFAPPLPTSSQGKNFGLKGGVVGAFEGVKNQNFDFFLYISF